ncbi:MAG: sugar ABC transporter permease, partial [Chloroflexi bacterium]
MNQKNRLDLRDPFQKFSTTRRGRILREHLTAYLFILPAGLIIFVFGLFPVAFAFFVSLHDWQRFPEEYEGLANYTRALGDFAYVLFVGLALGAILYAAVQIVRITRQAGWRAWRFALPGALNAGAIAALTYWFFLALPYILEAPRRVPRGRAGSREAFLDEFFASFSFPAVSDAAAILLPLLIVSLLVSVLFLSLSRDKDRTNHVLRFTLIGLLLIAAAGLINVTAEAIDAAAKAARASGDDLPLWSYLTLIGAGGAAGRGVCA